MIFLQQIVNGLTLGSVYALVAVGLSLIWATAKLLDFAFGEVFMLGGILAYTFVVLAGMSLVPALILTLALCALLGVLVERGIYFRLYNADHVIMLIATIGVSMILKDGATKIWGSETLIFPPMFEQVLVVGEVVIRLHFVVILACALGLIGTFHLLITRTRIGIALRAVAENREVAAMMGVNVVAMLSLAFGISYLMAAAAGALIGPIHYVATTGGTTMMVKGVAAAVLGGFGSLPGALVGGLAIGLIEAMAAGYVSSSFKDLIVFGLFIAVLYWRPQGLLRVKPHGIATE